MTTTAQDSPRTWPEKLREAAAWFDTVDKLLALLVVEVAATGETYKLVDKIGSGSEIQDDLIWLAQAIEQHDAEREAGRCASPLEFYPGGSR